MHFKSLLSPIQSITSDSFDGNFAVSPAGSLTQVPYSLTSQFLAMQSISSMVSSITSNINTNSFSSVTNILGGFNPVTTFTSSFDDLSSSAGNYKSLVSIPFKVVPNMSGGVPNLPSSNPLDAPINIVGNVKNAAVTQQFVEQSSSTITNTFSSSQSTTFTTVTNTVQTITSSNNGSFSFLSNTINQSMNGDVLSQFNNSNDLINYFKGQINPSSVFSITNFMGGLNGGFNDGTGSSNGNINTSLGVLSGALTGGPDGAGGGIGGNLGGFNFGFNGSYPFNTITNAIYNFTGGNSPLAPITNVINSFSGISNLQQTVANTISGLMDPNGNPTEMLNNFINNFTAGIINPNETLSPIFNGIESGNVPVVETIQGGITQLQELESLKTEIINSGINLLADNAINTIHQAEGPIADAASLGTLTFETSRDTVNGSLESISDFVGGDFNGAMDSATGVIDTLITNGSTATEIIQHIGEDLGNLGDLADGSPLEMVTDAIEGFTGGDLGDNPVTGVIDTITGGTDGSPLEMVTDAIEGFTGGDLGDNPVTGVIDTITGGTDGSPLEMVTDAIEGFTGGDLGDNPVTGVIDTITGGTDGSPLEMVTDAIEGFTGGDLG
ncbi:hypothetical protein F949_00857, partial [Acinetobacter junii NIPH 182]